jgi:uncharacterized Zn-binding protein involved in type VI secretion
VPAVARQGDQVVYHTTFATSSIVMATTTKAFANDKAIGKVGDTASLHFHYWGSHWYPFWAAVFPTGSNKDFVEGKGVLRVHDICSCGCWISAGSPDTFSE